MDRTDLAELRRNASMAFWQDYLTGGNDQANAYLLALVEADQAQDAPAPALPDPRHVEGQVASSFCRYCDNLYVPGVGCTFDFCPHSIRGGLESALRRTGDKERAESAHPFMTEQWARGAVLSLLPVDYTDRDVERAARLISVCMDWDQVRAESFVRDALQERPAEPEAPEPVIAEPEPATVERNGHVVGGIKGTEGTAGTQGTAEPAAPAQRHLKLLPLEQVARNLVLADLEKQDGGAKISEEQMAKSVTLITGWTRQRAAEFVRVVIAARKQLVDSGAERKPPGPRPVIEQKPLEPAPPVEMKPRTAPRPAGRRVLHPNALPDAVDGRALTEQERSGAYKARQRAVEKGEEPDDIEYIRKYRIAKEAAAERTRVQRRDPEFEVKRLAGLREAMARKRAGREGA